MSGVHSWRVALCCCVVLLCGPGAAGETLVLTGPVEKAYQAGLSQALAGFRESYGPAVEVSGESDLLRQLSAAPPRVILAVGRDAAQLAVRRSGNVPVLYILVRDPESLGLGGNRVAGIPIDIEFQTQFAYFKKLVPRLRVLGVLYSPRESARDIEKAQAAARALNLTLLAVPAEPRELTTGFGLIAPVVDAVFWILDEASTIGLDDLQDLLRETSERRIPLFTNPLGEGALVKHGALAAMVPDYRQVGRAAGDYVKRIERGELNLSDISTFPSPAVPIINLRTAARINLAVPRELQNAALLVR